MSGLIVFLGPTLRAREAKKLARCEVRPPARQGDVWRALLDRPRAIALIDGVFESQPSVWHQEIRAALDCGVAVFGASSMGALRAAELWREGMIGVGEIFESYRSGRRNDDADVALLHADAEHEFRALTAPMVNVEHALSRAAKAKVISTAELGRVRSRARALHYTERSWRKVFDAVSRNKRAAFVEFIEEQQLDLKADDARTCLKAADEFVRSNAPLPPRVRSEFASHVRRARLVATGAVRGDESLEGKDADAGTRTLLLARLARSYGLAPGPAEVARLLKTVRRDGLADDERHALAEALVLERMLLDAPERVFSDGPSRLEGLAFSRRRR